MSGIEEVIRRLKDIRDNLETKCDEFCRRLAEEGAREASRVYGSQIQVSVVPIEGGYKISANGDQVCFLEFGAGTRTNESHPMSGAMAAAGIEVRPKSYSEKATRMFAEKDFWVWEDVYYTYIEPQPGLWRASQIIRDRAEEIAKEVFGA